MKLFWKIKFKINLDFIKNLSLISKINSQLAYDTIIKTTENLKRHYEIEKISKYYIPYNYLLENFSQPVIREKLNQSINQICSM